MCILVASAKHKCLIDCYYYKFILRVIKNMWPYGAVYIQCFQVLTHKTLSVQVGKTPENSVARQPGNTDSEHKLTID